ncbi:hypothetical protein CRUP_021734 [Coryphaenoides rupestris]|nr:hypothetical protein CRUP_021734 [Coryphaenoides rupestris]
MVIHQANMFVVLPALSDQRRLRPQRNNKITYATHALISLYKHVRIPGRCPGSNKKKFAKHLNIKSKTNNTEQGTEKVLKYKRLPDCYVKLVDICRTYCPYCRKTFPSFEMTNKHMSSVHKVKGILGRENSGADEFGKYKCPLCPRVFKYSYNRARHLWHCIKEQNRWCQLERW